MYIDDLINPLSHTADSQQFAVLSSLFASTVGTNPESWKCHSREEVTPGIQTECISETQRFHFLPHR